MPTAETLALVLEIAERDVKDARARLADAMLEKDKRVGDVVYWAHRARTAEMILAARAASRARRDRRRAGRLAAARIRFLCPGAPVPEQPEKKGGAL